MKFPDSLPGRFQPQPKLYRSKYPNQPMLLHKGFAEILQGEDVVEGTATVLLVWFPHPHAKFEFTHFSLTKVDLDDFTLKLTELGVSAKAHASEITHYGADDRSVISGNFCSAFVQGSAQELADLTFYIPNFPFFNISNTWRIDEEEENLALFYHSGDIKIKALMMKLRFSKEIGDRNRGEISKRQIPLLST